MTKLSLVGLTSKELPWLKREDYSISRISQPKTTAVDRTADAAADAGEALGGSPANLDLRNDDAPQHVVGNLLRTWQGRPDVPRRFDSRFRGQEERERRD